MPLELHNAVKEKNLELVRSLIENGADVNKANEKDETPLKMAIEANYSRTVKVLIKNGADVNKANEQGEILLHRAITNNNTAIVRLLIKAGVNVNEANEKGETPLETAIKANYSGIAKILIEKGADVNKANYDQLLHMAITNDYIGIVKVLIEKGAELNKALVLAISSNKIDAVKLLIEKGAELNKALVLAISSNKIDAVKLLIEKGADVNKANEQGETPLYTAIKGRYTKIVKFLIEKGADVNKAKEQGETPLSTAIEANYSGIVKVLIKNGADVNKALVLAISSNRIDAVKLLIEKGADVNAALRNGFTPLDIACLEGHIETAKLLIGTLLVQYPEQIKPNCIQQNKVLSACWEELDSEISALKEIIFGQTSLFDFYSIKDENKLATMACNKVIQNIITKDEFLKKYPFYGKKVKQNFKRGLNRANQINSSVNSVYSNNICNNKLLPRECWEEVLKNLDNQGLRNVAEAASKSFIFFKPIPSISNISEMVAYIKDYTAS